MKTILAILLCSVGLSAQVLSVAPASDRELDQLPPMSTGGWPCDGLTRVVSDTVVERAIRVRSVTIWAGTGGYGVLPPPPVDVTTTVFTTRKSGFVLAFLGLDHYVPFAGPHQITERFDAPGVLVKAGEHVFVQHQCRAVGSQPSVSATTVLVWYVPERQ